MAELILSNYLLTVYVGNGNDTGVTYNLGNSYSLNTPIEQSLVILSAWHGGDWQYKKAGEFRDESTGRIALLSVVVE